MDLHISKEFADGPIFKQYMPKAKREKRYKNWCFTCNNPPSREPTAVIELFLALRAKYVFQLETGDSGTEHFQGVFSLPYKKGFQRIVSLSTQALPGAHFEACKDIEASVAYCQKGEGRVAGPWAGGGDGFALHRAPTDSYQEEKATQWQKDLLSLLRQPPHPRHIHWYYESIGGVGKSCMARHIVGFAHAGRAIIVSGRAADIRYRFLQHSIEHGAPTVVVVDIPRVAQGHLSVAAVESLKNGIISSGKYEGGQLVFDPPHVIVFSNDPPPWSSMSLDRWQCKLIQEDGTALEQSPVRTGDFEIFDVLV